VTSLTIISEVLAALPCDSHCGNACQYGQWSSWSIISKFQADQCNSSKAYNQTRTRHSFIKTCPSKSESKMICKCLYAYVFLNNRYNDTLHIAKHFILQLAQNANN